MKHVLVVWQNVPESTDFYLIPEDCVIFEAAKNSHDIFINLNNNEGDYCEQFYDWLRDNDDGSSFKFDIKNELPPETMVVSTGFLA